MIFCIISTLYFMTLLLSDNFSILLNRLCLKELKGLELEVETREVLRRVMNIMMKKRKKSMEKRVICRNNPISLSSQIIQLLEDLLPEDRKSDFLISLNQFNIDCKH